MVEYRNVRQYDQIRSDYIGLKYNLVEINKPDLNDKLVILDTFARALKFPTDFGRNWDAFRDYIRDLSWLERKQTAVLLRPSEEAPPTYLTLLDILNEASVYWKAHKVKFDVIVFG